MSEEPVRSAIFSGLAPALRVARAYKGMRQSEVAERAGVTKAMLSAFELGRRRPSLKTLEKLLSALEIDLDVLYRLLGVVRELREGRFTEE